jgi:hypothetical protein
MQPPRGQRATRAGRCVIEYSTTYRSYLNCRERCCQHFMHRLAAAVAIFGGGCFSSRDALLPPVLHVNGYDRCIDTAGLGRNIQGREQGSRGSERGGDGGVQS